MAYTKICWSSLHKTLDFNLKWLHIKSNEALLTNCDWSYRQAIRALRTSVLWLGKLLKLLLEDAVSLIFLIPWVIITGNLFSFIWWSC